MKFKNAHRIVFPLFGIAAHCLHRWNCLSVDFRKFCPHTHTTHENFSFELKFILRNAAHIYKLRPHKTFTCILCSLCLAIVIHTHIQWKHDINTHALTEEEKNRSLAHWINTHTHIDIYHRPWTTMQNEWWNNRSSMDHWLIMLSRNFIILYMKNRLTTS